MAPRRLLGCLAVAALAVCASTGCKDKGDAAKAEATPAKLDEQCVRLGTVCGEKDKHIQKIGEECQQAAKQQVEKGCTGKVMALYDCYEKELCGYTDKVWTLADLRVLADRRAKCAAERKAASECVGETAQGSAR